MTSYSHLLLEGRSVERIPHPPTLTFDGRVLIRR